MQDKPLGNLGYAQRGVYFWKGQINRNDTVSLEQTLRLKDCERLYIGV